MSIRGSFQLHRSGSNVNSRENRFRPAFEEDDLFRARSDLLAGLILQINEAFLPDE